MKHLIIICEGLTEINFCSEIIAPLLLEKQIYCQPVKIKKSGGGIVAWEVLKKEILQHLRGRESALCVTTFIDFYKLPKSYYIDGTTSVEQIECAMATQINNPRFIPYIQKYEFEALLLCDSNPYKVIFDCKKEAINSIDQIIRMFPNPEDVNHGEQTAPSKRIESNFVKYNKTTNGVDIAKLTGLPQIREKCPRFNNWIEKLIEL